MGVNGETARAHTPHMTRSLISLSLLALWGVLCSLRPCVPSSIEGCHAHAWRHSLSSLNKRSGSYVRWPVFMSDWMSGCLDVSTGRSQAAVRVPEPPSGRRWPVQCPLTPLDPASPAWYLLDATLDRVAGRRVEQSQNRRLKESYAMCARFPVMRSTPEQANLRWQLKTGGAVAIHSP